MKKILHVSKYYYPYYGGIEDVAHTIITELEPYFEQKIICFNHERGTVYNLNGTDVIRIGTFLTIASQPISFKYKKYLQKTIDNFRPDYIHLHLPNPLVASFLLVTNLRGAKIIVHWHADILGQKYIYPFYKSFEQKLLKRASKIIVTSEMYRDYSLPLQFYKSKTVILPNTINEQKLNFYKGEEIEVENIKNKYNGKKIVFFVGRHVSYKGINLLIEAERFIQSDCVVLIAGTGDLSVKLKESVVNKSRIKFIGRLSNNELKYYLHAATVFAFPSINRSEAFGVALAEALYCGLPAVSFNIKGSGALWVNNNNKTGFIVEEGNTQKFAEAIDKILSSDKLQNEFSQNAKEWVDTNFLKEQIVEKMSKIYD